jgi:hypothetical protein
VGAFLIAFLVHIRRGLTGQAAMEYLDSHTDVVAKSPMLQLTSAVLHARPWGPRAVPALVRDPDTEDAAYRLVVVAALGAIGDRDVIPVLECLRNDGERLIRLSPPSTRWRPSARPVPARISHASSSSPRRPCCGAGRRGASSACTRPTRSRCSSGRGAGCRSPPVANDARAAQGRG